MVYLGHDLKNYDAAMRNLYTAKWNVPRAAEELGLASNSESWELTKELFRSFCVENRVK